MEKGGISIMAIITGNDIKTYRLHVLRQAIKLEMKGLTNSRGSVTAMVKREFGFKGNRQRVLEQLEQVINGKANI